MLKNKFILTAILLSWYSLTSCSVYNCKDIYNSEDVTAGIQNAINSGAKKIIIPYMGKDSIWISGPLLIKDRDNLEIVLEPGVILESKSGKFDDKTTAFMTLNNCQNIKISGYNAEIRMLKHEYSDIGQWRHGISILSSDSIEILGLKISSTGGDGIYIGSNRESINYCSNIVIQDVIADKNARNGISVISCRNLLIENCEILNTGKGNRPNNASNGPWAGIDLEPNFEYELLENIEINNCRLKQNRGAGILFAYGALHNDISVSNSQIIDNCLGISLVGKQRGNTGQMSFKNNHISGKHDCGLYILDWLQNTISVNFNDCTFDIQDISVPVKFVIGERSMTPLIYGNIVLNDTRFLNVTHPCLIYLEGIDSINNFNNISLTNSIIRHPDEDHDFLSENANINSSYTNKSVAGNNIFCIIEKGELVINYSPNPVVNSFQVLCDSPNQISIKIYDSSGKLALTNSVKHGDFIDCHTLKSGQYIIIANDKLNNRSASNRIIKL
jgi:hypothetical protein